MEVVGGAAILITTSSLDELQAPLLIVHLNVALPPIVSPVTPELAEPGLVTVAVPDTTVQAPVPVVGVLPARVAVVTLHRF